MLLSYNNNKLLYIQIIEIIPNTKVYYNEKYLWNLYYNKFENSVRPNFSIINIRFIEWSHWICCLLEYIINKHLKIAIYKNTKMNKYKDQSRENFLSTYIGIFLLKVYFLINQECEYKCEILLRFFLRNAMYS